MILAFEHLAESTLANELHELEPVADLVTRHDSVVALAVVEAIVDEPFKFGGLILLIGLGKIVNFFILGHLPLLMN